MSEFIDFEDKSVDKAIEKACKELSVTREKLKYDIISYGSSGIFGLVGTKKALIRVTPPGKRRAKPSAAAPSKAAAESTAPVPSEEKSEAPKDQDSAPGTAVDAETDSDDAETDETTGTTDTAGQKKNRSQQPADESETSISELVDQAFGEPGFAEPEDDDRSTKTDIAAADPPDDDPAAPRTDTQGDATEAASWIKGFLEHAVRVISPESVIQLSHGENLVRFSIEGGDAARLIGKKGQTLDAIQYIVEKAVHKQFGTGISFEIDVEDYLDRRKSELRQLATKLAQKASESGKPMVINRINAHDRRIVHLALKKNREIRTQSAGNGDLRKLLILPKKKSGVKKPEKKPEKMPEKKDHAESDTL